MKRYGVMLDCSRNGVMKVSEVKHMIDALSKMGYNALELYTEDTFEIKGEPYFGYMRGRYTAEEIKEIDAYAISKGVELIPCIQTLAHFTSLVRHREYRDVLDVNDILLIDEPKTYQLIDKIFKTLAENFSSRLVNIGMDEAHMMGKGKFLDKYGYQDRLEVFVRHLNKVVDIAKKYGFTTHMWSDMFFRLANNGEPYGKNIKIPQHIIDKIPEDVTLAYWDYYHYNKSDYDSMFKTYSEIGAPVWFFGSVWTCCGFVPMWDKVFDTMKPAIESAIEHHIDNIFFCAWGDGGRECSYFASLPLFYALKQFSDGNFDCQKIKEGFYNLFGVDMDDFALLSKVNGAKDRREYISSMHLYNDCLLGLNDEYVKDNGAVNYAEYTKQLTAAVERTGEFSYIFDCVAALSSVLELKYDFGVRLRNAYASGKTALKPFIDECDEIINRIEKFYQKLKIMWHKENKSFGFEVQTVRIGGVIQRLKDCKERISDYLSGVVDSIEELTQDTLSHPEYDTQYFTLMSAGTI